MWSLQGRPSPGPVEHHKLNLNSFGKGKRKEEISNWGRKGCDGSGDGRREDDECSKHSAAKKFPKNKNTAINKAQSN